MNHILVGSVRYSPTQHIIKILDQEIKNTDPKKHIRVYFLDHRVDTRIGMADYIVDDESEVDHDVSYKISECSAGILSELTDNFETESKYSYCQIRIILFFNLDSIDSVDPSIVRSLLSKIQSVMDKLDIRVICHTSSRFVDKELLDRFDQIHMFKDTATDSLDGLMNYLIDTDKYYQIVRLRRLIAKLDQDSSDSIALGSIKNMVDDDVAKYGRIIVTNNRE
jgi:hypothetical protein